MGELPIAGSLVGSVLLLCAFVAIEARSSHPMLDLSLFRKPAFVGVSIVAFALSASMFSMFLYITIYMQDILGYDPLEAGVRFLPITLVSFFAAPIAGQLLTRIPARAFFGAGLTLVGIGLLLMAGSRRLGVDRAARGLRDQRRRDRDDESRHRLRGHRRGAA